MEDGVFIFAGCRRIVVSSGLRRNKAGSSHAYLRRKRRIKRGLTQQQFAKLIGVNFWQAHKYEHGTNSVSAGRLYVIARELSTPLEYFFEGLEPDKSQPSPRQRKLFDAMRDFGEVRNEKHLGAIRELTRALAGR